MRFSFWTNAGQSWNEILAGCQHAERTGWDGIWIADHFMPFTGPEDGPIHECWSLLSALAASVPRVRIGSIVAGNTYRNPAVLLKQAVTIDHISGGRLVLGLGAGWQENEHTAYGIEFSTTKGRLDRLDEACALIMGLQHNERFSFSGTHYRVADAPLSPRPVQPHIPLLIGGGGETRTMRTAARWADEWNVWGTSDLLAHKNAVLNRHCEDLGRDPASIRRSANALLMLSEDEQWLSGLRGRDFGRPTIIGTPSEVIDQVADYEAAGVHELLVPDFTMPDPERKRAMLDLFIERVAPTFR